MIYKRELERKYIVDMSAAGAEWRLKVMFPNCLETHRGRSQDIFWSHPTVDFVRLRGVTNELTIKISDKGTTEDRVEENVVVDDMAATERMATALFGAPVGQLWKNYYVMKLPSAHLSLYTVDSVPGLFLEIESNSLNSVREMAESIERFLPLEREYRSLYQIGVGK